MHRVGYVSSVFHLPATTPSSSITASSAASSSAAPTSCGDSTTLTTSSGESAPSSSASSSFSSSCCGSDNELKMRSSRGSLPGFLRRSTAVYHVRSRNFARANLMKDCGHLSASGKRCCREGGGAASSTTSWSSRKTSSASSSSLTSPASTPSTSSSALSLADWWPISGLTASRNFLHGTAAYEALAGGIADEDAVVGAFFGFYALPESPQADPADVSFLMDSWRRFTLTPDGEADPQIVRYQPKQSSLANAAS